MIKPITTEPFLEELILSEMSRANTDRVAGVLLNDKNRFAQAIQIVMQDREPVSRRALWAIDIACEKKPGLITPYMPKLLEKIHQFSHHAFRRHILRMAARLPLNENTKGDLLNICFDMVSDLNQPIAVKANAIQILTRIAIDEPDILHELNETINWQIDQASPGFKSQAKKVKHILNHHETRQLKSKR